MARQLLYRRGALVALTLVILVGIGPLISACENPRHA
jgi:hypothetical protein